MSSLDLARPIELPCGLKLPNRIAKAPMEEMLGPFGGGQPNNLLGTLYAEWAKGGFGMMLTGNVQVSQRALGAFNQVAITGSDLPDPPEAWKKWAAVCHSGPTPTPAIMQLCHPGRQSPRGSGRLPWEPALAPSAVTMEFGNGFVGAALNKIVFGTPRSMTEAEIKETVEQFRRGAVVALRAGFDGVEIHCSHGYLVAQFLSPKANIRTDRYGATPKDRIRLLFEIIDAIRSEVPSSFCVGIKLNSADYVEGGLTEQDALKNVKWIVEHGGVDFIEISGGTYENVTMLRDDVEHPQNPPSRTERREAFFAGFSRAASSYIHSLPSTTAKPAIMLTGGFRTRPAMIDAVTSGTCDLIGLGRPTCLDPRLPLKLLDADLPDSEARCPKYTIRGAISLRRWTQTKIPLIGTGINTVWHTWQLRKVAYEEAPDPSMSVMQGLWWAYSPRSYTARLGLWLAFLVFLKYIFWV